MIAALFYHSFAPTFWNYGLIFSSVVYNFMFVNWAKFHRFIVMRAMVMEYWLFDVVIIFNRSPKKLPFAAMPA